MSIATTKLLKFPNPVNEYAARSVAGMVLVLCIATLIFQTPWLLWALALGSPRESHQGRGSPRSASSRPG